MIYGLMDLLLIGLMLSSMALLISSRLTFYVRAVALQGVLLGLLPMLSHGDFTLRVLLLAVGTVAIKSVVFPLLLLRVVRNAGVRREIEPYLGYGASLFAGILLLLFSLWLNTKLTLPRPTPAGLVIPTSFFMIMIGFLIISSRRKAITQVLGYIVLENGIYAFGAILVPDASLLVELGVLLDVFVAVFVMGIIIFHISREFDHIDTDRLAQLRDWSP
jgi:hydrogenase-4 component E